jgi:hypothetical protein
MRSPVAWAELAEQSISQLRLYSRHRPTTHA